jgi:hypothetical protein
MVHVRLARNWTDLGGSGHHAGELVDVDAATLAALEASGVVTPADGEPTMAWAGPTGEDDGWAGPTGDDI